MEHNHTFVVCTYQESPYLEQCLLSVLNQTVPTNVIISTSTPNDHILGIAKKYNVPVFVNTGKTGIQEDWNFAIRQAKTDFVTVCHHDDYYYPTYAEEVLKIINKKKAVDKVLYIHTGYRDIDSEGKESVTKNTKVKRLLNFWMKFSCFQGNRFFKKRSLSLGNTVCCPSCTYNTKLLGFDFFDSEFTHCCDWDFYYKAAKMRGKAVYISKFCMAKRYHAGSQTSADIKSGKRVKEDYAMFCKFWPKWIAKLILRKYKKAYDINR